MAKKQPNYLGTADLIARWKCKYTFANEFMHREGSKAIKIGKKLLIDEREVIAYEEANRVKTGY